MSGEPSTAAEASGPGSTPELRASHEDRDQVVEIRRVAAGDGRLTAAELDERLEAALTARTHSDVVPQRMEIHSVGGNVKLNFTDAVITQPTLRIGAQRPGGNLVLVTKPGIEVDPDDVRALGGRVKVPQRRRRTRNLRAHRRGCGPRLKTVAGRTNR